MSQHPSLKFSRADTRHRNVLKRIERIKLLREQGKLETIDSLFKLPKVKRIRLKIKKEKAEEKTKAPAPETASAPETKETKT
ncbi:MAG: small basic protein [Candidatus Omnitrophota bacterium]